MNAIGWRQAAAPLSLVLAGGLAMLLAGCHEDEQIAHYKVPRLEQPAKPVPPGQEARRMLVAIFQRDDQTWFFKVVGPLAEVETQADAFERFLQTVHFTGKPEDPVAWQLTEGWRQGPALPNRQATILMGPDNSALQLAVSRLGDDFGGLVGNINRWRGQLGLGPIRDDEVGQFTRELQLPAGKATLVTVTNPGSEQPAKKPPFTYTTPEGWKEDASPKAPRLASFQVAAGDQKAELTVTAFPGEVGGLVANVNRWRDQVGLEAFSEEKVKDDVRKLDVAGSSCPYVDLTGPARGGEGAKRILAVLVKQGETTYFFTLKGPDNLVGKQKAAFESFMKSVRFEGGK